MLNSLVIRSVLWTYKKQIYNLDFLYGSFTWVSFRGNEYEILNNHDSNSKGHVSVFNRIKGQQ